LTPGASASGSLRWLFLGAAIALYLLLIALERGLVPPTAAVATVLQRRLTFRQLRQTLERARRAA
jgi:hypothetical protein